MLTALVAVAALIVGYFIDAYRRKRWPELFADKPITKVYQVEHRKYLSPTQSEDTIMHTATSVDACFAWIKRTQETHAKAWANHDARREWFAIIEESVDSESYGSLVCLSTLTGERREDAVDLFDDAYKAWEEDPDRREFIDAKKIAAIESLEKFQYGLAALTALCDVECVEYAHIEELAIVSELPPWMRINAMYSLVRQGAIEDIDETYLPTSWATEKRAGKTDLDYFAWVEQQKANAAQDTKPVTGAADTYEDATYTREMWTTATLYGATAADYPNWVQYMRATH